MCRVTRVVSNLVTDRPFALCPQEYGIPEHYGMLESLGVGIMVVGVLSGSYHVCPNRLNIQFGEKSLPSVAPRRAPTT